MLSLIFAVFALLYIFLICTASKGADRYYNKIKEMIDYYPSSYVKYCWKFFTSSACFEILSLFLIKFSLLKYNKTYQYPWWGYAIGILLAFSSALLAPLWLLYSMAVTPGTLRQRLKTLCTPAADLCDAPPKKTLYPETPLSDTELYDLTEKP